MSKRASPTAIGLFMIGAVVLAVAGIVTLASTTWFRDRPVFISYFEESVHGLEVGSPVKFEGVPVGQVTDLMVRIDPNDRSFLVPVTYEINLNDLTSQAGTNLEFDDEEVLEQQIVAGLRAQLQMESIVTGLLYIELSFLPDAGDPKYAQVPSPYPQIPTVPSLWASLGEEAGGLLYDLQQFDFAAFNRNLMQFMTQANEKLAALDVAQLNASLLAATNAVEALAASEDIRLALRDVPEVSANLNRTLTELQRLVRTLDESVAPLQAQLETTTGEVNLTLGTLRKTIEETQRLLSPEHPLGYQMEEALGNLSEAAEALRLLAASLERNPSAFLRGRRLPEP